jgi:hypothetical protein
MSERPKAGEPPDLTAPTEVLRFLLGVECERLVVALSIEAKRELVFPETTVIIRDIERLMAEVERRDADGAGGAAGAQKGDPEKTAQKLSGWAPADLSSLGD